MFRCILRELKYYTKGLCIMKDLSISMFSDHQKSFELNQGKYKSGRRTTHPEKKHSLGYQNMCGNLALVDFFLTLLLAFSSVFFCFYCKMHHLVHLMEWSSSWWSRTLLCGKYQSVIFEDTLLIVYSSQQDTWGRGINFGLVCWKALPVLLVRRLAT